MLLFFAVMVTVLGGGWYYVGSRLLGPLRLSAGQVRLVWTLIVVLAATGPLSFVVGATLPRSALTDTFQWLAYVVMGLFSLIFVGLVARDLLILLARGLDAAVGWPRLPVDPERRAALLRGANGVLMGLVGGIAGVGGWQARRLAAVVHVDVPVAGLPASLDGFRIAQITDIHIGPTLHGPWLTEVVQAVNALSADVVAVTGDLIDGRVPELRADVAPLGGLLARHGVYFVTGNHEYYWDAPAWLAEIGRLGLRVLENEHVVVEHGGGRVLVAGVPDLTSASMPGGKVSDPSAALAGAPEVDVKVLLAHQPRSAFAAAAAGFQVQLSGHTHGGQYFPFTWLVKLAQPFDAGLHVLDQLQIYVSRGTGYWGPPLRLGAPAEITLLTLRRA